MALAWPAASVFPESGAYALHARANGFLIIF